MPSELRFLICVLKAPGREAVWSANGHLNVDSIGGDHGNDDNGDGAKRGVPAWLLSRATLPLGTHPFREDGSKVQKLKLS